MTEEPAPERGVILTRSDDVLTIQMSRPSRGNAMWAEDLEAISQALDQLSADGDPDCRAVVLTGDGQFFCTGADVSPESIGGAPSEDLILGAQRATRALLTVDKPVVAAVNGPAAGIGCVLALASDVVIAPKTAYFLAAFTRRGLMPDGGLAVLLRAAVGRGRGLDMCLRAERIPAEDAARWGMVTNLVERKEFDDEVASVVNVFRHGPTLAFASTKRLFNSTILGELDVAFEAERRERSVLLNTLDRHEGLTAFRERRAANFTGR